MSEKSKLPSRFILSLITISLFILILSSMFLLQFSNSSLTPRSVFKLILTNTSTSIYSKHSDNNERAKFPFGYFGSSQDHCEEAVSSGEIACQVSKTGLRKQKTFGCDPSRVKLKVFMYDLPPEFHFLLMGWKGKENQIWPDVKNPRHIPPYAGGLNLQHSMEYWLTLDLLSSNIPTIPRPCTAIRVANLSQADVIFVPFFASLSYNRFNKLRGKEKISVNKVLQERLVNFLTRQEEWKKNGGKNHVIVSHHPNSMLEARKKLGSAMFVLADFGRYPFELANLGKDIIAPYKHLVKTIPHDKSAPFDERHTLIYFQGEIYRKDGGIIRQELYYLLKDEKNVHFSFGSAKGNGVHQAEQGMASSKFCLNIAGDTPSSNRLFDSIASHCVPVIISDEIELPFEDVLDYSEFCIFIRASDSMKKGYVMNLLNRIDREKWTKMWERLKEIAHHFEYQYPSREGDAVHMIWEAISRRFLTSRNNSYRQNRLTRSRLVYARTIEIQNNFEKLESLNSTKQSAQDFSFVESRMHLCQPQVRLQIFLPASLHIVQTPKIEPFVFLPSQTHLEFPHPTSSFWLKS